jgi:hypothetical protein
MYLAGYTGKRLCCCLLLHLLFIAAKDLLQSAYFPHELLKFSRVHEQEVQLLYVSVLQNRQI